MDGLEIKQMETMSKDRTPTQSQAHQIRQNTKAPKCQESRNASKHQRTHQRKDSSCREGQRGAEMGMK